MPLHTPPDRVPDGPQRTLPTVLARPAQPVFVDITGTRRRRVRRAGVMVAAASLSYLPMAASALLPGPAAPAQPGPLFVKGEQRETGDQPGTAPTRLDGLSPQDVPELKETVDSAQRRNAPESRSTTVPPPVVPAIRPPVPAPAPSRPAVPAPAPGRPAGGLPADPPSTLPPTSPPAQVPGTSTPPPTALPTVTLPATPDLTRGAAG